MKKPDKDSERKEKKSVEFALPKESASTIKLRYGPDGRRLTEVEVEAQDYIGKS